MTPEIKYCSTTENEQGPVYEFETDDYQGNQEEYSGPVKEATPEPEPKEDAITELLKEEAEEEAYDLIPNNSIYYLKGDFWDDWDKVKGRMKKLLGHHDTISEEYKKEENKLFFLSHSNDKIIGKPQLIEPVMRTFPLIKILVKKEKNKETKEEINLKKVFTLGERADARYDGYQADVLGVDFWLYRIIDKGKEYVVLSEEEFDLEEQELRGMKISVDDYAEMSRSLKIKTISNLFIVRESVSTIKELSKEELIGLTKALKNSGVGAEDFKDYVFWHKQDNRIYDHTESYNKLKQAQLLSGKYEGYPLHIMKTGPAGTGKTCEQEADLDKFQETEGILEGADSRPKVLEPSFKEKPANVGYIAKCNRFAMIDELFKMIENYIASSNDANAYIGHLGGLNFLLEQKKRNVGSGNNNSAVVKSTAKILITTNPMKNRNTISDHVGIIDPTTMSRLLVWVQSPEEIEKAYSKQWKVPRTPKQEPQTQGKGNADTITSILDSCYIEYLNNFSMLENVFAEKYKEEMVQIKPFLSIYDSCQAFLSEIDENRVRQIIKGVESQIKGPMLSIWRPRGLHHAILVLDGLIKLRCLFKDYDKSFQVKEEDYNELEKLLHQMVKNWDTNLQPKEDYS